MFNLQLKPEGCSLEKQQTVRNHEKADRRRDKQAAREDPNAICPDFTEEDYIAVRNNAGLGVVLGDKLGNIFEKYDHNPPHDHLDLDLSY